MGDGDDNDDGDDNGGGAPGCGGVIDVLLADDHPLILHGLREVLTAYSEFRIIGAETDALKVVDAVLGLRPDVLVIDYSMPRRSGTEVVREVASRLPSTRALILSMHSSPLYVSDALASGALGYVLKCADGEEIVQAIRTVHEGQLYLSAPLCEGREEFTYRAAAARVEMPLGGDDAASLTKRELEVLGLVVVGHTSGEIAERLQIGRRTVESHRSSLMTKLGARNQIDLVREAVRRGLASLEGD